MIIYLSIVIFIFLLASFLKNRSSISMRFLLGIFGGWIISLASLILYLSKQNYYWREINNIFYITRDIWNLLIVRVNIRPDLLIRSINVGVGLFYYSAICFAIAFTSKESKKNNRKYLLLAVSPLLQVFLFDPLVQKYIQLYISNQSLMNFDDYNLWLGHFNNMFQVVNGLYCLVTLGILINFYITHPKIKFLKIYTLFNLLCITPIILLFFYLFRWHPMVLVKATMKKGYYNYLIPNFQIEILNNPTYYFVFLIAYILLIIYILKYNTMESYYKRDHANISISIDTASLGVNTFTHAIKNHIQGIRSEAQYLSKHCQADEEAIISTKLIMESCDFCFASIENANKQLKNIHLNLKLIPVEKPIENAMDSFHSMDGNVELIYEKNKQVTMAYIDEEAFTEVLVNMIANAYEAIEDKTHGEISIRIREQGRWGIIEIKDNGRGIDEDHMNKIFSPFFTTKSSVNNWGVGLAFCYKVVTAHDGKITAESVPGKGTLFSIALPIL
ncbi:HAMP domain-containing sensor histidine kinase [Vallitaleaceae bacterium 9-2]